MLKVHVLDELYHHSSNVAHGVEVPAGARLLFTNGQVGTEPDGTPRYTRIAEIKNLNSFRSVERAVAFEIARHREEYEADPKGYTLENLGKQTRGWKDDQEVTFLQRSKEEAHDYRYFPEPDLVPFVPDRRWVEEIRASLPELPEARRRRFIDEYGLPEYDAGVLTADPAVSNFFDEACKKAKDAKTTANLIMTEGFRVINEQETKKPITDLFNPGEIVAVSDMVYDGKISRSVVPRIFDVIIKEHLPASDIVTREGLAQTSDAGELETIVEKVIADNPGPAGDYRGGKEKALGRLIGEAMKASSGKANPKIVRDIIVRKLRG